MGEHDPTSRPSPSKTHRDPRQVPRTPARSLKEATARLDHRHDQTTPVAAIVGGRAREAEAEGYPRTPRLNEDVAVEPKSAIPRQLELGEPAHHAVMRCRRTLLEPRWRPGRLCSPWRGDRGICWQEPDEPDRQNDILL